MKNIEVLLSDARGVYIPNNFYTDFDLEKWHVNHLDLSALSDYENEWYWETWESVLNNAYFELNGKTYNLYQDGDLLAICYDELTDEEKENLGFED